MMEAINQTGHFTALYVNIEAAQAVRNNADRGIRAICQAIAGRASHYGIGPELQATVKTQLAQNIPETALTELLTEWACLSDKPCVLFLDEVDALIGDTLISLLRQIRAGYDQRPDGFPQSIVLCGVRDVRDYRIHSSGEIITGGSAFNIKSKSLRMGNFSQAEVKALYRQHSDATGQLFAAALFEALWQDTQGQPWLVNALGHEMTWESKANRDRSKTIELEDYQAARERLIYARTTHLDQLSDKLKESRVHSVIAPLLATDNMSGVPWDNKIWHQAAHYQQRVIGVWGC